VTPVRPQVMGEGSHPEDRRVTARPTTRPLLASCRHGSAREGGGVPRARSKALGARARHLPARGHRPARRRPPGARHPSRHPCPRPRHRDAGHVTFMLYVFSYRFISRFIVLFEQYPLRALTYHKDHSSILRSSDSLKVLSLWP